MKSVLNVTYNEWLAMKECQKKDFPVVSGKYYYHHDYYQTAVCLAVVEKTPIHKGVWDSMEAAHQAQIIARCGTPVFCED